MSFDSFKVDTAKRVSFINITSRVQDILSMSAFESGMCTIFVPHTTAGITINEAADPAVVHDMKVALDKLVPSNEHYTHAEGNSDAHIKASLMGSSVVVPVVNRRLVLGTWQGIFFCEFDGPRQRSVFVQVTG
jgi:secondary thiamine-phosphate synthase enzyme